MNFSMKTRSSPNDALASAFASPNPSATSRGRIGDPHALAAAAGGGLDHDGIADGVRDLHRVLFVGDHAEEARHRRDIGFRGGLLGFDLVAHRGDRAGVGSDEDDAGLFERARKGFALGQEAIAGMHGLGAGLAAGLDDLVHDEIALGGGGRSDQDRLIGHLDMQRIAVGLGIDGNRLDPHPAGGLDDPAGDLAAIGDQNSFEHFYLLATFWAGFLTRNLACGGGCNNSVVQQNGAEATVSA